MIRVFIAGPIQGGPDSEPFANIGRMIQVAEDLVTIGCCPWVPGLCALWAMQHHHDRSFWLMYSQEWLSACDAVFRMAGDSSGADAECEAAEAIGIPIFCDLDRLAEWVDETESVGATTERVLDDAPEPGTSEARHESLPQATPAFTRCPDCQDGYSSPEPVGGSIANFRMPHCKTCEGKGVIRLR